MLNPINAADIMDTWDGDPNTAAAWRERERRQRSVRMLMMFLLMLLLMDGEEQSIRRHGESAQLRKRKISKKKSYLDVDVFEPRTDLDTRLIKITRSHPRFKSLLDLNDNINHEASIRQWAEQQSDEEILSLFEDSDKKVDPNDSKKVWHYPWNSTGFYRGEWILERNEDGNEESEDEKPIEKGRSQIQYQTSMELESIMTNCSNELNENIGLFLLPPGKSFNLYNLTNLEANLDASKESTPKKKDKASSTWLLGLGYPELNEVLAKPEEESRSLTKDHGRAAFQLYSRSVPGMKELSLVDGFIKLYDSNTIGYSTRRDILLRARGVLIHSIGRVSLISNAQLGRAAFVVSEKLVDDKLILQHSRRPSSKQDPVLEGSEARRRRLSELVTALDSDSHSVEIEEVRDNALDIFSFDFSQEESFLGKDDFMLNSLHYPPQSSLHEFSRWFIGIFVKFFDPSVSLSTNRRLSETTENQTQEIVVNHEETSFTNISENISFTNCSINSSLLARRKLRENNESSNTSIGFQEVKSSIVFPFPYVPDDKQESMRKAKTAADRRMPLREQMLEENAGRCEFEINLDVKETEWSLGDWRALLARNIYDSRLLDPKRYKKETENEDGDTSGSDTYIKTKHSEPSVNGPNDLVKLSVKPRQIQALVMAVTGSIQSPNCNFKAVLNASAIRTDWESTTGKAINYSFYMMLTCLAQIIVLLRQLLHTQHHSTATRVSLLCIGWHTVVDALLCLGHIYLSLAMQPLFTAFASVAFFKLLIFCVIEMKYMAIILQARNNANGATNTSEMLRRQVATLHVRFYFSLLIAFFAFFYAGQKFRTFYMLALYSFWVPQIILNVITEAKRPLHSNFIYGMSISRCVVPIYMFAVRDNFLREVYPDSQPNYVLVESLVVWISLQVVILLAQEKYGARFMIPMRFLPPKYDYHRKLPPSMMPDNPEPNKSCDKPTIVDPLKPTDTDHCQTTGTRNRLKGGRGKVDSSSVSMTSEPITSPPSSSLDCVICCNEISYHNRKGYMLAPCDHIFHKDCLIQWMEVKMECPICRTELPAI
jgi:transmembrane E3 ubiquitin-protein ligase